MKMINFLILASLVLTSSAYAGLTKPFGFIKQAAKPSSIIMRAGDTVVAPAVLTIDNFVLAPQTDGNLVLYRDIPSAAIWSTSTWSGSGSCPSCTLEFRADGNLVLRDGATVKWSSNSPAAAGGFVQFRNKSPNIIIFNSSGVWHWNN